MAASPMSPATVPPPPGGPTPPPPPAGADASPAPAQPSPQLDEGSRMVIQVVQNCRQLAQKFPTAVPEITQINDLMRRVQMKVMAGSKPTEPAAPPTPSA